MIDVFKKYRKGTDYETVVALASIVLGSAQDGKTVGLSIAMILALARKLRPESNMSSGGVRWYMCAAQRPGRYRGIARCSRKTVKFPDTRIRGYPTELPDLATWKIDKKVVRWIIRKLLPALDMPRSRRGFYNPNPARGRKKND